MMGKDQGARGSTVSFSFSFLSFLQRFHLIRRALHRENKEGRVQWAIKRGTDATGILWDKNKKRSFVCSRKVVILGDDAINRNIRGG